VGDAEQLPYADGSYDIRFVHGSSAPVDAPREYLLILGTRR
jgi:hypothetical protein